VLARLVLRPRGVVRASLHEGKSAIEIDPLDSDLFVAAQVSGHKEYALDDQATSRLNEYSADLRKADRVPVIIDGGANVGSCPAQLDVCLFQRLARYGVHGLPRDGTFLRRFGVRVCGIGLRPTGSSGSRTWSTGALGQ
jgi:hypothetical protein